LNNIKIIEENTDILNEYSKISIEFKVESEYKIKLIENGLNGINFNEEMVSSYWKNYDSKEHNPSLFSDQLNLENWQVISAFDNNHRIGGALIAYNTDGVHMLEGKDDLAVLWDIRIDKAYRSKGIGTKIFQKSVEWARKKKCTRLKIETQNNNVNACKFYVKQGAKLSGVNRCAYGESSDEVQFIWSVIL